MTNFLNRDYRFEINIDVPLWLKKIQNSKDIARIVINFKTKEISLYDKNLHNGDREHTVLINAKLVAPLAGRRVKISMSDDTSPIKFSSDKINGLIMPMRR